MTDALEEDTRRALLANLPLGRMGEPEDVAHLASFLASDMASYISGGVYTVDGGMCV
jgi:3-oxoacyl-[acyl-carrier protein] reductase